MNIAKRLALLLAVPLLVLAGLAVFVHLQLTIIDDHGQDMADTQVPTLAILGSVTRAYGELRVDVRDYVTTTDASQRNALAAHFRLTEGEMQRLFEYYARALVTEQEDRQLLENFRGLVGEWLTGAREAMAEADRGQTTAAYERLHGRMRDVAVKVNEASEQWIHHNETAAATAAASMVETTENVRRRLLIAGVLGFLVTAGLGFLTFRRIVTPIRALEASVRTIAAGDYEKPVPYVQASDETGSLARSVEVLKEGAAQTHVQARQLAQQAEALRQINLLSDTALDLTKTNYWRVSFDEPEWYYSSERGAKLLGQEPAPNFRYRLADWMQQVRLGDPAAAEATFASFAAAVAGRSPRYDAVYAFKRPTDGRVIWLHSSGHIVRDAAGREAQLEGPLGAALDPDLGGSAGKVGGQAKRVGGLARREIHERGGRGGGPEAPEHGGRAIAARRHQVVEIPADPAQRLIAQYDGAQDLGAGRALGLAQRQGGRHHRAAGMGGGGRMGVVLGARMHQGGVGEGRPLHGDPGAGP